MKWILAFGCWLIALGTLGCKGTTGAGACGDCPTGQACFEGDCRIVCSRDSDCGASEVCRQGHCMPSTATGGDDLDDDEPHPDCPNPPIPSVTAATAVADALSTIYAGQRYRVQGTVHNSTLQCPIVSSWWVCDAPADSTYFSATDGGCRMLIQGHAELAFRPDRRGAYRLEFRGTNVHGVSAAAALSLTALADDVFVQVTFGDEGIFRQFFGAMLQEEPCHGHMAEGSCNAEPGCAWSGEFCWADCAGATTSDQCFEIVTEMSMFGENDSLPLCDWNEEEEDCTVLIEATCGVQSKDTCAALSSCEWFSVIGLCMPSCAQAQTEDQCTQTVDLLEEVQLCSWNAADDQCEQVRSGSAPAAMFPQFAIAQVGTDGGRLGLLQFIDPAAPTPPVQRYVYDRNQVFDDTKVRLGLGLELTGIGMSSLPGADAAVFPASYLVPIDVTDSENPANSYVACWIAQTLLLWRASGNAVGVPSSAPVELVPGQGLIDAGDGLAFPIVAYPHLAHVDADALRVVFGLVDIGMPNLDEVIGDDAPIDDPMADILRCDAELAPGFAVPDFLHGASPFLYSMVMSIGDDLAPIRSQSPFPLHLAQVNGETVDSSPLRAAAQGLPCSAHEQCWGACVDDFCPLDDPLHGYMPRTFMGGSLLTYSRVTCGHLYQCEEEEGGEEEGEGGDEGVECEDPEEGRAYGHGCAGKQAAEYDLMLARVVPRDGGGFWVDEAAPIAQISGVREIDAVIAGRPSDAGMEVIYLEMDGQAKRPVQVLTEFPGNPAASSVSEVFENATAPYYRILRRTATQDSETKLWTIQPAADEPIEAPEHAARIIAEGSATELLPANVEPFECRVMALPNAEPPCNEEDDACDDRGVMYVTSNQEISNPIQIAAASDGSMLAYALVRQRFACVANRLVLAPPVASDIYVVDLTAGDYAPELAYPSSCASTVLDGLPVRTMPQFVAGGNQIVFTASGIQPSQVYRMNLADRNANECLLDPVLNTQQLQDELQKVIPDVTVLSASLADSRSSTYDACTGLAMSCSNSCAVTCNNPDGCCNNNATARFSIGGGQFLFAFFVGWMLRKLRRRSRSRVDDVQ